MPSPLLRLPALLAAFLLPAACSFSGAAGGPGIPPKAFSASGGGSSKAASAKNVPTQTALNGFFASAFSSEYGDEGRNTLIRWETPIRIFVMGTPTEEDISALDALQNGLKANVPGLPEIGDAKAEAKANVVISFVPYEEMAAVLSAYVPGNWGFMNCFYDDGCVMRCGKIAIASDVTSQKDRNHLIREEFVNMLGLAGDIDFARESILYQPYTRTQALAKMDYEMLSLLYGPYVKPGMTREQAQAAITKAYPSPVP